MTCCERETIPVAEVTRPDASLSRMEICSWTMGRSSQEEVGIDVDEAADAVVALGIRGGDKALCNILVAFWNGLIGLDWIFACVYISLSSIMTVQ